MSTVIIRIQPAVASLNRRCEAGIIDIIGLIEKEH